MSASWMLRYDDLHPNATAVLRAIILLNLPEIRATELAVTLDRRAAETTAAIETLRKGGWVETNPSGADTLDDGARRWLTGSASATAEAGEAAEIAGRYASYFMSCLDVESRDIEQVAGWASEHRAGIVAAVRAAAQAGLHEAAADLAAAAWRVADRIPDPVWWRELAPHGEDAAEQARDPGRLFALLNLSAITFAGADDKIGAAKQWIRALRLADRTGNYRGTVQVMTALGELYRRWGRLDKAMDMYAELVEQHERAGDLLATAGALIELGQTMLAAEEPGDAAIYLSRADDLLASESTAEPVVHARALELLGQAHGLNGQPRLARGSLTRAIGLLGNRDHETAARIHAHLATVSDGQNTSTRPGPPGEATQDVQQRGD